MDELKKLRARLAEIVAELETIEDFESQESVDMINALNDEATGINGKIETLEKVENLKNLSASAGRQSKNPGEKPKATVRPSRSSENGLFGFDTYGDFLSAVKNVAHRSEYDERLKASAQQEKVGTDGGFMVPEDFRSEIHKKFQSDESLLSRTRQFSTSSNRVSMLIDEAAPWAGQGQNIAAYWENERSQYTRSARKLAKLNIETEKLTALVVVTEEMLEDAAQIESYVRAEAPDVLMHKLNSAIVSGDGVGKPEGYLNSAFAFQVAKESGQAADTVVFNNLKKLYTHALPSAKRNGLFLFNVGVEEQLIGMKLDPTSTDSVSVYLPSNSIDGAPYGTLWGRPVMPMLGSMPALGDAGDIALADFSYYYTALKTSGIKQQVSTHVYFDTDEVAYKFSFRVGGKTPFKSPAKTEFGNYSLSGITYLAERA